MSEVRAEGVALATAGKIVITQGGEVCRPSVSIRGPIRYRLTPPQGPLLQCEHVAHPSFRH